MFNVHIGSELVVAHHDASPPPTWSFVLQINQKTQILFVLPPQGSLLWTYRTDCFCYFLMNDFRTENNRFSLFLCFSEGFGFTLAPSLLCLSSPECPHLFMVKTGGEKSGLCMYIKSHDWDSEIKENPTYTQLYKSAEMKAYAHLCLTHSLIHESTEFYASGCSWLQALRLQLKHNKETSKTSGDTVMWRN